MKNTGMAETPTFTDLRRAFFVFSGEHLREVETVW